MKLKRYSFDAIGGQNSNILETGNSSDLFFQESFIQGSRAFEGRGLLNLVVVWTEEREVKADHEDMQDI